MRFRQEIQALPRRVRTGDRRLILAKNLTFLNGASLGAPFPFRPHPSNPIASAKPILNMSHAMEKADQKRHRIRD
jgi:hypothetical protein